MDIELEFSLVILEEFLFKQQHYAINQQMPVSVYVASLSSIHSRDALWHQFRITTDDSINWGMIICLFCIY